MKRRIHIDTDDIIEADLGLYCPVAQALANAFDTYVEVESNGNGYEVGMKGEWFPLPDEATAFLKEWESCLPGKFSRPDFTFIFDTGKQPRQQ